MGQHADIATLARQAAGRGMTGSVEVHPRSLDHPVTLYFYDGRLYALHGEGCEPPVVRRLLATGVLDATSAERMLANADGVQAEVGKAAVRAGLLPVERLAALHQEFLLAAFGTLTAAGDMKATFHGNARTSAFCALPAPVDDILATVQARAARTAGAWQSVTGDPHFQDRALLAGDGVIALTIPEADAIRAAVRAEGAASIDSVAYAVGLTRAEAVHLVAQLVRGGELVIGEAVAPAAVTLVPEALLDAKPKVKPMSKAKPMPKPETERKRRGWFRRQDAVAPTVAQAVVTNDTTNDTAEPVVEELMTSTIEIAGDADESAVEVVEVVTAIEVVEAVEPAAAFAPIEEVVAEAIPLVIDPAAGSAGSAGSLNNGNGNGNGWHHEPATQTTATQTTTTHTTAMQAEATTTVVRAMDSELVEAVHARLDHLMSELDDLRRLLRQMEAQS